MMFSTIMTAATNARAFAEAAARTLAKPSEILRTVDSLAGSPSTKYALESMMSDRHGRSILKTRPKITDETIALASQLPSGTLGKGLSDYLLVNKGAMAATASAVQDPYEAYVLDRFREVHCYLHVLTECKRTALSEACLHAMEYYHTGLPSAAMAALGKLPEMSPAQLMQFFQSGVAWAQRNSPPTTANALNVRWEELLHKPITEVRNHIGIVRLPNEFR